MLLAVHFLRFSDIFYPRAQSRGVWLRNRADRDGMLVLEDGKEERWESVTLPNKTNHIIPFPILAAIAPNSSLQIPPSNKHRIESIRPEVFA